MKARPSSGTAADLFAAAQGALPRLDAQLFECGRFQAPGVCYEGTTEGVGGNSEGAGCCRRVSRTVSRRSTKRLPSALWVPIGGKKALHYGFQLSVLFYPQKLV